MIPVWSTTVGHGPPGADRSRSGAKSCFPWVGHTKISRLAAMRAAIGPWECNSLRLRALLEERFRLKFHRETRKVPIYSLTVAKSGLKLQPSSVGPFIISLLTATPAFALIW